MGLPSLVTPLSLSPSKDLPAGPARIQRCDLSPVEVGTATDGHEAVGVGQLAEHTNLVVVLETRPYHGHRDFWGLCKLHGLVTNTPGARIQNQGSGRFYKTDPRGSRRFHHI